MKYSLRSLMKFTIRDLFLVTVIVAILTAWWLDHRRQSNLVKKLWEANYSVYSRGGYKHSLPIDDY